MSLAEGTNVEESKSLFGLKELHARDFTYCIEKYLELVIRVSILSRKLHPRPLPPSPLLSAGFVPRGSHDTRSIGELLPLMMRQKMQAAMIGFDDEYACEAYLDRVGTD